MSRPSHPSSSSSCSSSLQRQLSAYAVSVDVPSSSPDAHLSKLLSKFHHSTKASERVSVLLTLAESAFNRSQPSDALLFYSASLSLSLTSHSLTPDLTSVLTTLRRIGECHHQLHSFPPSFDAFTSALSLLPSLPSSSSSSLRLQYELHLSLGNAYLDWADADDVPLPTSLARTLLAHRHHSLALQSARSLAGLTRATPSTRPLTPAHASLVLRAHVNLGNAYTQLLHLDLLEIQGRHRCAPSAATDSSSSSLSPPSSPPRSVDPTSAPVDDSLSSLPLPLLQRHRLARYHAACACFDTALTLAVAQRPAEARLVWDNTAALHEAMGHYRQACDCYERAAGGKGWQWRLQAALMWTRAERWDEAVRAAGEVERAVTGKAGGGGTAREKAEAKEQVDTVYALAARVQRLRALQAAVDRTTGEGGVRAQVRLLHRVADVSAGLAESGVGVEGHWAAAMAAHQQAMAAVAKSTEEVGEEVAAAVRGYFVYSVTRYLPHLARVRRGVGEVEELLGAAGQAIRAARAAGQGEEEMRPVLSLFAAQLALQCGGEVAAVMAALQGAWGEVEEVEREEGVERWVLRAEILAVMGEALAVGAEEGGEEEGREVGGVSAEWVGRMARKARRQMEGNEEEAEEEKLSLARRLWLLPDDEDGVEEEAEGEDEANDSMEDETADAATGAQPQRAHSMEFDV